MSYTISFIPSQDLPLYKKWDNIWQSIVDHFPNIENWDIFVVAQKIVSKVEWMIVNLDTIKISEKAKDLAERTWRTPWLCQAIINASKEIVEIKWKVIVTRLESWMICTSAWIDKSNIEDWWRNVILLPKDSDESAKFIREEIERLTKVKVVVIISDSLWHPNRNWSIGMAIWISWIASLEISSQKDLYWNVSSPKISKVDEIAAWASLLMWQWDQWIPIVQVKWVKYTRDEKSSIKDTIYQW